ncbi:30S ribosomal protein S18 [Halanaerobaculum tunisiense]
MARGKSCEFCAKDIEKIDYKDVQNLRKYITDRGKILPRRITGNCAQHQRKVTSAIKRARNMALLPFKID